MSTRFDRVMKTRGSAARAVGAMLLIITVGACSSSTAPGNRPTEARIRVDGEAGAELRLIVSTNFYEDVDDVSGQVYQVFNDADTVHVTTFPYEQTVALTTLGSVVVDLANLADAETTARLRVNLDGGQDPYDQSATMSRGGSLRYVFAFISPRL